MLVKQDFKNYQQLLKKMEILKKNIKVIEEDIHRLEKSNKKGIKNLVILREVYEDMYDESLKKRLAIESAIHSLEDEKYENIMRLKYIEGKTFWQIAQIMNYDEDYIKQLHRKILKATF